MGTKFKCSIVIITKVGLQGYVIYFSAVAMCISQRINNIGKQAKSVNNSYRKMQSGSLYGGVGGEYSDVNLVQISEIFVE